MVITKQQIGDFYWCLRCALEAQVHLQNALIHYSNNNMGYANQAVSLAQSKLSDSQTSLQLLIGDIMEAAVVKHE